MVQPHQALAKAKAKINAKVISLHWALNIFNVLSIPKESKCESNVAVKWILNPFEQISKNRCFVAHGEGLIIFNGGIHTKQCMEAEVH